MTQQIRDRVGTELANGRYRLTARVAEGTMGQVYRAHDCNLETEVVIKFPIAPEGSPDASAFLARFHRESRSLIRLSHPHIVKVIDAGEDDGIPFLVMPYLAGGSLKDRLEPGPDGEPRPMAPGLLHGWLMDVAKALDFLHAQGHVHRDVKPANILFDRHGNAFLGDFGVVKILGADDDAWKGKSALTTPGYLLGTPNYVAPELVMGQPCDGRADQYALALSVHESLIGWNVMEGPTPSATMVNQTKVEPPAPGVLLQDVPARLSEAVLRGLSKGPRDRFEDCSSMAREILADIPAPIPGEPPPRPVPLASASAGEPGRVPCPACGGLLPVVPDHAGRRITCTRCRAIAVVQFNAGTLRLRLMSPPPEGSDPPISTTPVLSGPRSPDKSAAPGWASTGLVASLRQGPRLLALACLFALAAAIGSLTPILIVGRLPGDARIPPDFPPIRPRTTTPVAGGSPVTINILHGTEKKNWLEAARHDFLSAPEGRGITINLIGRGSIQGADDILNGPGPLPIHAWSPASTAYRSVFEREWEVRRPGDSPPILEAEELVLSPLVFVFWKERYEAFLKHYGKVDFRTLGEAMSEPGGWGTIAGKPEWGLFRFAHTHPARSNSGLMTLVLMACEFTGKARGLTLADISRTDFQLAFQAFERGVTRHGTSLTSSTGTLMQEMILRGPSGYDGLVLYENLAIDYMKAARQSWGELQVVYPDPNLWNDHPYYILDAPWSDRRHQDAAGAFLKFLRSEPIQRLALELGFRPGKPAVGARAPDGPIARLEANGLRLDVPRMAEPPRAEVVEDLLSSFRRIGP
ncbi:protein kinase domain-containing protein [Tundrisphaera lichenicola]|uniref:protein kinase domain-containing protein n=1 Tax=Tundrisphaera lichenicola TaxID=2029860 RepID=UPI003EC0C686